MTAFGTTWTLDLCMAPKSEGRPSEPSSSHLIAPLLHVLGEKSKYTPRVFFDPRFTQAPLDRDGVPIPPRFRTAEQKAAMKRKAISDAVLRAAGLDPDHETLLPFPLRGNKPMGFYRRIEVACYRYSSGYPRPTKNDPPWLFVLDERGWALTEAGVGYAVAAREHFATDGRNATAIWFEGQMANGLYEKLHQTLMYEPKLAKERVSGEITDHLHTFIATSIRRDAFRSWLARGDAPTTRQMCEWAIRKGISAFRRYSQDSLHRTMRGALTSHERNNGNQITTAAMVPTTFAEVFQGSSEDTDHQDARVLVDTGATEQQLHDMAWNEGLDRVRDAIRRHKPGAAERYVRIFDLMCQGYTVAELGHLASVSAEREQELRAQGYTTEQIGQAEGGVSRNRAASIMADCREAIRNATQAAKDARSVLLFLQDEPYSTLDDLKRAQAGEEGYDTLRVKTDLDWLVPELVIRGRIGRQEDGCHLITDLGEAFLAEWDMQSGTGDFGHRVSL